MNKLNYAVRTTIAFVFLLILASMSPVNKRKIIFFGDSITQMGINEGGYIHRLQDTISKKDFQHRYELIGAGVGGNKIYDLYLRLEEDVLDKKPDMVVIYIGVNDIWHKTSGIGVDITRFEKFYVAIIKKLQEQKIKMVLATPACIGELKNNLNPQDDELDKYSEVIRRLAATHQCSLVDLRQLFKSFQEKNNTENKDRGILTTDRVHLNDAGNSLVAEAMIKPVLGF